MARPGLRGMLGADPMYQEYQKSGAFAKVKPKRNRFVFFSGLLVIMGMAGLLITLITQANWLYCVPVFLIVALFICYIGYLDWKDMRK